MVEVEQERCRHGFRLGETVWQCYRWDDPRSDHRSHRASEHDQEGVEWWSGSPHDVADVTGEEP